MPHQHHPQAKHGHAKRQRDGFMDFIFPDDDDKSSSDSDSDSGSSGSSDKDNKNEDDVVFVTIEPTFDGPVGGFTTKGQEDPTKGLAPPVQRTRTPTPSEKPKPTPKPTAKSTKKKDSTTPPTPSTPPSSAPTSTLVTSTSNDSVPTPDNDLFAETDAPSITPTASAQPSKEADSGVALSGGGKAGIAIGAVAGVAIIAGLVFFFLRKRKQANEDVIESGNEKLFTGPGAPAVREPPMPPALTSQNTSTAPQLNVAHVSQFSPNLGGSGPGAGAMAAGAAGGAAAGASRNLTGQDNQSRGPNPPPKHGDGGSDPFQDPTNPFNSPHQRPSQSGSPPLGAPGPSDGRTPSPQDSARTVSPDNNAKGAAAAGMAGGAAAAAAAMGAGKGQSESRDGRPASPALSEMSASGGPGPGPNNVHRVQLDFNPSMEDELELRSGQLARLLHEYDDGWALCTRMDRSQQGVAPRSCLSARPVKPRPRGPPPGPGGPPGHPNGRPMSPATGRSSPGPGRSSPGPPNGSPRFPPPQNGPPSSPASGYRPFPPQGGPGTPQPPPNRFNEVPRSLSPGPGGNSSPRSMSPSAGQRQRSNSSNGPVDQPRNPSPPGPSNFGPSTDEPSAQAPTAPTAPPSQPSKPVDAPEDGPGPSEPAQSSLTTPDQSQSIPTRSASLGPADRKPVPGQ